MEILLQLLLDTIKVFFMVIATGLANLLVGKFSEKRRKPAPSRRKHKRTGFKRKKK